jgi:single stranded DNA-binding protein
VNIEAWGRLAETCHEYLGKGSLVYVEGRMKTDRYEDGGEIRYFTKVVARTVQFLSDNRDDEHLLDSVDVPEEEEPELADASDA